MKAKVIAFLLSFYLPCFGQGAIDDDCGFRSARILGQVMLDTFGPDLVRDMLERKQWLLLWLKTDSLGNVLKIDRCWETIPENRLKEMVSKLENFFQKNVVQIPIYFTLQDIDRTYEEQLKLAIESFRESGPRLIPMFFPGELPLCYEIAKDRGYGGSMFEYFLLKLNEQEINHNKEKER